MSASMMLVAWFDVCSGNYMDLRRLRIKRRKDDLDFVGTASSCVMAVVAVARSSRTTSTTPNCVTNFSPG